MRAQGSQGDSCRWGDRTRWRRATIRKRALMISFLPPMIDAATLARVSELHIRRRLVDMPRRSGFARHRVWLRVNPGFITATARKTQHRGENSNTAFQKAISGGAGGTQKYLTGNRRYPMAHIGSGVDYTIWSRFARYAVLECVRMWRRFRQAADSIPYREREEPVDTRHYYGSWNAAREQIARHIWDMRSNLEIVNPDVSGGAPVLKCGT